MAQEYDNNNRGSIWKNDKKESDKHPDFTGSAMINGVDMWVSAWKRKEGANAKAPALSFTFKAKDESSKAESKPANSQPSSFDDFEDSDSIPF
jgi:hypothetical protein